MSGTTWKKKSRQGLPEERKVGDMFSVNPIGPCGLIVTELKFDTIRSMNGLDGVEAAVAVVVGVVVDLGV